MSINHLSITLWLSTLTFTITSTRSPHRPVNPLDPYITVCWEHDQKHHYTYRESHLQEALFNLFDREYFFQHLIPQGPLAFRYEPEKTVLGTQLSDIIEELIIDIKNLKKRQRKVTFKNFNILKIRDVNKRDHTGLFVLKFKDYPFVLKLFIETPYSVVHPMDKGFEPICFYYLAGLSRHFNGFTRIKNLENIKKIVQADPYWSSQVDFPYKGFWLPKNPEWIVIEGKNIGSQKCNKTVIPAIYGIICDEIIWERVFTLKDPDDREKAINLSNFLGQRIDSHINNFGREIKTRKIVAVDYEHFVTAVGIEEGRHCDNYFVWYSNLTFNALKRLFFQNKEERRMAQHRAFRPIT